MNHFLLFALTNDTWKFITDHRNIEGIRFSQKDIDQPTFVVKVRHNWDTTYQFQSVVNAELQKLQNPILKINRKKIYNENKI